MTAESPFATSARRFAPGAKLNRHWPLKGGVCADVDVLEASLADGSTRRGVVRQHGAAAWKPLEADVTSTEFALLKVLHDAGMPVPTPWFLDTSGEVLPSPSLVMAYVEGTTAIDPAHVSEALRTMADCLARLHALDLEPARSMSRTFGGGHASRRMVTLGATFASCSCRVSAERKSRWTPGPSKGKQTYILRTSDHLRPVTEAPDPPGRSADDAVQQSP